MVESFARIARQGALAQEVPAAQVGSGRGLYHGVQVLPNGFLGIPPPQGEPIF